MNQMTDQNAYRRRRLIAGALGLGALGTFGALRYGDGTVSAEQADKDAAPRSDEPTVSDKTGERLTHKFAATH